MRDDFSFLEGSQRIPRPRWWVYAPIVSPLPKVPIEVFSLAEYPLGFYLHFRGRHFICRQTRDCPHCHDGQGRDWKGFLPAVTIDYKRRVIIAVTDKADDDLKRLRDKHGSILGFGLLMKREGRAANSPVVISDTLRKPDQAKMPKAFDVRPQVLCTHGMRTEEVIKIMEQWQSARAY